MEGGGEEEGWREKEEQIMHCKLLLSLPPLPPLPPTHTHSLRAQPPFFLLHPPYFYKTQHESLSHEYGMFGC